MRPDAPVRSIVLWLPDWPVIAVTLDGDAPPSSDRPIAVVAGNAVVACSAAARAEGVRRGQRRRDAQARCPGLLVVAADPARDHRTFAPLVARIEEQAPGVQLLRPGLCAVKARGPARYHGGEHAAALMLQGLVADVGDARAGVADGPFTAEQAARAATSRAEPVCVVPAGGAGGFLAPLPVTVLGDGAEPELLARLGVQTLGAFAAMDADRVRERFGDRGARLHALAGGLDSQPVVPRTPPPELHREIAFEPPLELAEQVAFGIRIAADEFIAGLGAAGLVCTELRVELVGDRGERSDRVWLHPGSFDAAAVVDRVRWQLAEDADRRVLRSGVSLVRIVPETVDAASHHAPAIFGQGTDERVHHALSRVQAMLGHRGVATPVIGGGRWLAERQVLVPWGDRVVLAKERARPWPGSLPDPLPGTVFAVPVPVEVVDGDGDGVAVGDRDALTAEPAVLWEGGTRRQVTAWAGPWPVMERTWDAARSRRAHRFQVVDDDGTAWLLVCESGQWQAEGRYD
ncbi:DNA polymerase Y family protein [Microbacterium fluvii]|uniref:DNA polymerase Y family protein n=1 Tax=Microbacterium fluvii TaxID=415215 RepID=A0ABW2HFC6_9MICO|nr:DNA polymerase Y family protein [Microbacterium fluvii]MCU4671800.1 DNA polymerase Y family protein [Microbacterium fluvii]